MKLLVTNDDGIHADGLRALAGELSRIARVTVVAPDREQSAIGTAVTLRQPLRVQKTKPLQPGIETFAVDGTPSDSVIMALENLVDDRVSAVVSGINHGLNLGEDVLISGTVGAAMQAYLRGFPTLAVSVDYVNSQQHLDTAARVAAILVEKIVADSRITDLFLNINLPDAPLSEIAGVKITRLASESHINTVVERGNGRRKYYWLVRQKAHQTRDKETDIWAVERGYISITPLYTKRFNKAILPILNKWSASLLQDLGKRSAEPSQ